MKVLYDYVAYTNPKKGVFLIDTNEYSRHGWVHKEEEMLIIGESDDCFITRLLAPDYHTEWVGDKVINHKYKVIVPIGPHKSRFVRWTSVQLSLF